jgi:hypothetical protein
LIKINDEQGDEKKKAKRGEIKIMFGDNTIDRDDAGGRKKSDKKPEETKKKKPVFFKIDIREIE